MSSGLRPLLDADNACGVDRHYGDNLSQATLKLLAARHPRRTLKRSAF
jgi:hypothetical protein